MKKYFAYDALEREFTTHDTLEEAKSQAQDYVDHTFDIGADNGFGDDLEDGIKETCFGVVLGGFDLPTRSLTKEEEDIYGDQYTYMVENPVLVEYPRNGWIKCSERLPDTFTGFDLLVRSSPVLVYGKYTSGEKNKIFGAQIFGNKWYSADGECGEVTHWQPFPQPPEE